MKQTLTLICAAGLIAGFTSSATAADSDGAVLSAKYNCTACHAVTQKIVGPGFRDVARKYAGDTAAPAKLAAKVKSGGSGAWGSMPMPPNNVPDADLKPLVAWVLSQN